LQTFFYIFNNSQQFYEQKKLDIDL